MNLENANVLSLSRQNEFFDSDFRFGSKVSYDVQGYLLDLGNSIGVSGVLEASEFFRTGLQDYQDIIINGENFGKGRVSNFEVNESNFVQYTTYSLSINGFQSGNLHNLSGEFYGGLQELAGQITPSYLLENFSEDFNFDRADNSFSYIHSINIKFASGDNILINPVDRAKALATYIMTGSNPSFGFIDSQTSGLYTGNFKVYFDESYDKINNEVSITKRFNSLNPSGEYSISMTHSLSRNENGVTDITEDAEIKTHISPFKTSLQNAVDQEMANSFDRVSGVYQNHRVANSYELKKQPSSISKNLNFFEGVGDYSIDYTNNPSFNQNYTWVYTHQLDRDGAFWRVSENGDIQGLGNSPVVKFENAKSAFEEIKTGIFYRTSGFYSEAIGNNPIFLIERGENKNAFNGTVNYVNEYTDEPARSVDGLKLFEVSVVDDVPVDYFNTYEILGFGEIAQSIQTTTLGERRLVVEARGERSSSLNGILDIIKPKVNELVPSGNNIFISDGKYNFNEQEKVVNLNLTWNYNRSGRNSEVL